MKAGVSFNEFDWNKKNLRCQSQCQADNLVRAYHCSANCFLEPYTTHFDKTNWWLSAYILNMYISAIGPEYCASYNEIVCVCVCVPIWCSGMSSRFPIERLRVQLLTIMVAQFFLLFLILLTLLSFSWVVTNSQCMPEYVVWRVCVKNKLILKKNEK